MPHPRASGRFSPPSTRSSCEPIRNGRRPPVHAPQKTPKETLVDPLPNLLLTMYESSWKVALNLNRFADPTSGSRRENRWVGEIIHPRNVVSTLMFANSSLPCDGSLAVATVVLNRAVRIIHQSRAPTSCACARVTNRTARYPSTVGSLPVLAPASHRSRKRVVP